MKNKRIKRLSAFFALALMSMIIITNVPLTGSTHSLSDSVRAMGKNQWYRELIAEQNGRYVGQEDYKFDLVDVDSDGVDDLIISYRMSEQNQNVVWLWSYNQYVIGEGGYTNDANEIYYCKETKYVKCIKYYSNYTRVQYGQLSMSDEDYLTYYIDKQGNFVTLDTEGTYNPADQSYPIGSVITDDAIIQQYEQWETQYMPNPVNAVGKYEVTDATLDKYLPTKETVTLGTVELKVGEAWGVSIENIDKLLAAAGYSYKGTGTPTIFYGDRVVMDNAYLLPASGVGVHDAATSEFIEMIYMTADEFPELFEQYSSGALTEKYGREVILVDEAEGMEYYAKAQKAGTTEIVIPAYSVVDGDASTIEVKITVVITDKSQGSTGGSQGSTGDTNGSTDDTNGSTGDANGSTGDTDDSTDDTEGSTGDTDDSTGDIDDSQNTITSTTDDNISIKNENNVLPSGTVLSSAKIESGETFEQATQMIQDRVEGVTNYAVYELDLSDADGVEIHQLSGKVSVTMRLPFTMGQNSTLKVYRVDGERLIECRATVANGMLTFETDHFSTYIFVEQEIPTVEESTDATPPSSNIAVIVVVAVLLLAAIAGVVVFVMKKKTTK